MRIQRHTFFRFRGVIISFAFVIHTANRHNRNLPMLSEVNDFRQSFHLVGDLLYGSVESSRQLPPPWSATTCQRSESLSTPMHAFLPLLDLGCRQSRELFTAVAAPTAATATVTPSMSASQLDPSDGCDLPFAADEASRWWHPESDQRRRRLHSFWFPSCSSLPTLDESSMHPGLHRKCFLQWLSNVRATASTDAACKASDVSEALHVIVTDASLVASSYECYAGVCTFELISTAMQHATTTTMQEAEFASAVGTAGAASAGNRIRLNASVMESLYSSIRGDGSPRLTVELKWTSTAASNEQRTPYLCVPWVLPRLPGHGRRRIVSHLRIPLRAISPPLHSDGASPNATSSSRAVDGEGRRNKNVLTAALLDACATAHAGQGALLSVERRRCQALATRVTQLERDVARLETDGNRRAPRSHWRLADVEFNPWFRNRSRRAAAARQPRGWPAAGRGSCIVHQSQLQARYETPTGRQVGGCKRRRRIRSRTVVTPLLKHLREPKIHVVFLACLTQLTKETQCPLSNFERSSARQRQPSKTLQMALDKAFISSRAPTCHTKSF